MEWLRLWGKTVKKKIERPRERLQVVTVESEAEKTSFGAALRRLRESAKMTRKRLADRIGVDQVTVYNWERGQFYPNTEYLLKLRKVLGPEVEKLLGNGGDEEFVRPDATRLVVMGRVEAGRTGETPGRVEITEPDPENGALVLREGNPEMYDFPRALAEGASRDWGRGMVMLRVIGGGLEPDHFPGDLLVVERGGKFGDLKDGDSVILDVPPASRALRVWSATKPPVVSTLGSARRAEPLPRGATLWGRVVALVRNYE